MIKFFVFLPLSCSKDAIAVDGKKNKNLVLVVFLDGNVHVFPVKKVVL